MASPYLEQLHRVLPRLLALYDTSPTSPTWGMGDRYYWAWKLIDFGNGTFQGAAHGLARLLAHGLLPPGVSEDAVLRRIDAMFTGADRLRRGNGSMEEAFPHEASFCVTALVAHDLLTCIELLDERIPPETRRRYLDVVRPMIGFLVHGDETHAMISNHLATAVAALVRWSLLTGEPGEARGRALLARILEHQSDEGWFQEYEGADPGYQSLCTYYLADVHALRPDLGLFEPLRRSIQFLAYFAHPDGSFGGLYGSRNTRFYYPAGIEALSDTIPEAAALGAFMRGSVASRAVVTLETMDEPNLIPMWNAYAWAAALEAERGALRSTEPLPAASEGPWRKSFPGAGLVVDRGARHYTIVSWHKGGVVYHFPADAPAVIDAGVVVRTERGELLSTQAYQRDNTLDEDMDTLTVTAAFAKMHTMLPTAFRFAVLRTLCLSVMRHAGLGNLVKKLLVKLMITGKGATSLRNQRRIISANSSACRTPVKAATEAPRRSPTPGASPPSTWPARATGRPVTTPRTDARPRASVCPIDSVTRPGGNAGSIAL